jgi:hypothetical protein
MANFVLTYAAAGGSVGIEIEKPSSLVAPAQVWLRAMDYDGLAPFEESGTVYDGAHHEYYHEWTINGEPLPAWSKPQNLLAEHNNPNKAYGREVAFVLPEPGQYVIDLVVTDRLGNQATASTGTLIVFDPESYFPPADRIYVDTTGIYSGVPAASGKVASLEALRTAMASRTSNPTWVLLARGQSHSLAGVNPTSNDNLKGVLVFEDNTEVRLISAYGTGAKPVITPETRADRNFTRPMFEVKRPKTGGWRTVSGLEFRGDYDPELERGPGDYSSGPQVENWDISGGFSLFHDIKASGLGKGYRPGGSSSGGAHHHLIADCGCDGWRDFASFGGQPGQHLGYVGCSFVQRPNVPNRGDKDDIRNTHGPIRISNCAYVYVAQMDLFSRNHWDGNDQPCLRLFTRPEAVQTAVVERCSMEGGFELIHLINSENTTLHPANILMERLLLVATTYTSAFINAQRSGLTLRNSVLIAPNVAHLAPSGNSGAVQLTRTGQPEDETAGVYSNPVAIYGNTYLNLIDAGNDGNALPWPLFKIDPAYDSTIIENNLHHRPVGDIPVTADAPVDTTTVIPGFTPRYRGRQNNFAYPTMVLQQDIPDNATLLWPYAEIGTALFDGESPTGPTGQAYWQAIESVDTRHQLNLDGPGPRRYHAGYGHIEVSFADPVNVAITNRTGETWTAGKTARLWLDRSSLLPEMDTAYANPGTVPLPRPQSGSDAIGMATAGRIPPGDFLLGDRGATPSKGALEPAT